MALGQLQAKTGKMWEACLQLCRGASCWEFGHEFAFDRLIPYLQIAR